MLQDTAHEHLAHSLTAAPLDSDTRSRALDIAVSAGVLSLKIFRFFGERVEFTRVTEDGQSVIKIHIPQNSESGEHCGEGFYDVLVSSTGNGLGGRTEYSVDGRCVRNCRLSVALAQKLADKVFTEVLAT